MPFAMRRTLVVLVCADVATLVAARVVAPAPAAALDAELPLGGASRFTVRVEDGRELSQCLLASLNTEVAGGKRRLTYGLRCENVTTP